MYRIMHVEMVIYLTEKWNKKRQVGIFFHEWNDLKKTKTRKVPLCVKDWKFLEYLFTPK